MIAESRLSHMLTVGEAARILHIHHNTLRRWSDQGLIRSYRINGRGDRRFNYEDITRFLVDPGGKCSYYFG